MPGASPTLRQPPIRERYIFFVKRKNLPRLRYVISEKVHYFCCVLIINPKYEHFYDIA